MLRTSSTSPFGMIAQPATDSTPHPADVIMEDIERRARPLITDAEARLVFELARAMPGADGVPELSAVTSWRRVLQLASDENAVIALRDALRHAARGLLPADVERKLAILSLDRECRMRRLRARLEQLLVALNQAKIDVLLLKGGALAASIYGSCVARPMRDIDLLVTPDRADEVRALMLRLGWTGDPELPGDRSYSTHHHLPPLRDLTASGVFLEIHRSLLPAGHPFRFTDAEIWRAARPIRVGAGRALAMHPTHHAVHIAIHFAWSHMMKLGGWNAFRDLDALSTARVLDWNAFAETARRWGASSACYWTLRLARVLSGLVAPDAVMRALAPRLPELVRRPLTRHFVNGVTRSGPACPSARLDQALWSLAMQPRRDGHGDIRPWLVSLDLLFAFKEKARANDDSFAESPLLLMRRSTRYISEILA